MDEFTVHWTDYMRYRAEIRGFDLEKVEEILRYSAERYTDTSTGRLVVVGRVGRVLLLIAYERELSTLTPITVHVTTRRQVNLRRRSGRYQHD